MRARTAALGGAAALVLVQLVPAARAATWPTGAGGGTTRAVETISRYGSSSGYTMNGVVAIGAAVYRGPMTASATWGSFSAPSATIQGTSGSHTISGTCTPSGIGVESPTGPNLAEVDTFKCVAQIDAAQAKSLTIRFSLVADPPAGPCLAPVSTCYYNYVGTFTAY